MASTHTKANAGGDEQASSSTEARLTLALRSTEPFAFAFCKRGRDVTAWFFKALLWLIGRRCDMFAKSQLVEEAHVVDMSCRKSLKTIRKYGGELDAAKDDWMKGQVHSIGLPQNEHTKLPHQVRFVCFSVVRAQFALDASIFEWPEMFCGATLRHDISSCCEPCHFQSVW